MAKLNINLVVKNDAGVQLGNPINSGDVQTLTAAKAVIQAVIDQRRAVADAQAADLAAADAGFNS